MTAHLPQTQPAVVSIDNRDAQPDADLSPVSLPAADLPEIETFLRSFDGSYTEPKLRVDDFHVFTLLATIDVSTSISGSGQSQKSSAATTQYKIDEHQLEDDLNELDHYLLKTNTRRMESLRYAECPAKTFFEIQRSVLVLDRNRNSPESFKLRDVQEIFDARIERLVKEVSQLAKLAREIREEMFSDKAASDYMTTFPHEFIQAW
ncbi:hypothetical protein N0V90_001964 [Kalmusia sp. IMI 367209]|nr:hypothetical protein N0V90_001964 [Kalmusia sp. IMI 367209]